MVNPARPLSNSTRQKFYPTSWASHMNLRRFTEMSSMSKNRNNVVWSIVTKWVRILPKLQMQVNFSQIEIHFMANALHFFLMLYHNSCRNNAVSFRLNLPFLIGFACQIKIEYSKSIKLSPTWFVAAKGWSLYSSLRCSPDSLDFYDMLQITWWGQFCRCNHIKLWGIIPDISHLLFCKTGLLQSGPKYSVFPGGKKEQFDGVL